MLKRISLVLILAMCTARSAMADDVPDADVALASRMSDFGTDLLRQKRVDPAYLQACAAMLRAAAKLDPSEPRYPRLLADACLASRDIDGAIAAYKAYRLLAPNDLGAQIGLIQLNLSKMETVDAKLAYGNQILGAGNVSGDVRSAVAVQCAKLLSERGQQVQADAMLDQAIRLNPLNSEALRLRYESGFEGMSDYQKAQSLMNMIRANPLQPAVVAEFAERVADFGLVKQSLEWYFNAMKLYQKSGGAIPLDLAEDYGAEQYIAERYDGADGMAIRLLQGDPNNINAMYLRLLCVRVTATTTDDRSIMNNARTTLLAHLADVRDSVLGVTPTTKPASSATTQPVELPKLKFDPMTGLPATTVPTEPEVEFSTAVLPDMSAAMAKVDPAVDSPEKSQLISVFGDVAWYSIYFDPQPAIAQVMIDNLAKLVPADNVMLVRLQGWNLLIQNKPDEAKIKLNAIADRDALGALGLIKLTPVNDAEANNRGRKLLSENPSKMLAAFLKDSLRDRAIKVTVSEKVQLISQQLDNFPIKWMNIIDKPSDFYLIRGVPMSGQFEYREPMLVNITIQNLSEFDITIGPDGVVRNDLWIDAQMPLPSPQNFPGTAYDRITQQIVLRARQTMSQVVRVDQGALAKALNDNPTVPQQIWVTVLTNPISTPTGVGAGAGGYRVQLTKMIARAGFAIGSDLTIDKTLDALEKGTYGKITIIDTMATYIRQSRTNTADDRLAKVAPMFAEKLSVARTDPSISVRGYSQYISASLAQPATQSQQFEEMSRSENWSTRLLGAMGVSGLDDSIRKPVLTDLTKDADPIIKDFATAMLKVAPAAAVEQPAAPTTVPTSQP